MIDSAKISPLVTVPGIGDRDLAPGQSICKIPASDQKMDALRARLEAQGIHQNILVPLPPSAGPGGPSQAVPEPGAGNQPFAGTQPDAGQVISAPQETNPVDAAPADTGAVDALPADSAPVDALPADTAPADPVPADGAPQGTDPNVQAWLDVYQDRLQRANEARDPAMRQHFEAELDIIRKTLDAMGVSPPGQGSRAAQDSAPIGEPAQTQSPAGPPMQGPAGGRYDDLIDAAAHRHGVDPNLVKSVIAKESQGNPQAVSDAGACGLMQVKPSTAAQMLEGGEDAVRLSERLKTDPAFNIDIGTKYLAQQLERTGNSADALGAYNQGPGADWTQIPESQDYVSAIEGSMNTGKLPSWN